jgi:hypothetical protein
MESNCWPEGDAGMPQADAGIGENRDGGDIIEEHGRNQAYRCPALCVATRQPAGDSQGEQRGPGQTGHHQSNGRIERCTEQELVRNDGTITSTRPVPDSITAVIMSRFFMVKFFSCCLTPPRFNACQNQRAPRRAPARLLLLLLPLSLHCFLNLRFHSLQVEAGTLLHGWVLEGGHGQLGHFLLHKHKAPELVLEPAEIVL